ncbi:MAG: DegT/DnrJ/EryC1/StrS family aminotransferase [Bryobacteraceae bacterium]|nr:DegT/DnrJ/EryC1/StrS family aminotransferase [Bryobacteraceae bacterium]
MAYRIGLADLKAALAETEPAWRENLARVHERSHYILGPEVEAFEREFAAAMNAKHAVGVASGSDAIAVALRALGIRGEVLTSALTAPFTAVAIRAAGAQPQFADIDPETLLVDPGDLADRVTKRTQAIVPVHLYGQPLRLGPLKTLKIPVLQDACQAHGAPLTGLRAYSFYPTKNLGCLGDGGAVVTDDARFAKRLREIRDGGRRGGQVAFVEGINSRLDEIQACYLRAFLPKLGEWNRRRRRLAAIYDAAFEDLESVRPVRRWPCSVVHLYVVRARRRDKLREHLAAKGIATGVHYPQPLHLHPAFADNGLRRGDLPHTEKACREIVSLPLHPFLDDFDVESIANEVRTFYCC